MAQTSPSNVFSPQVVVDLVSEQLFPKTTLLNSGYIKDARANANTNVKGDQITVIRQEKVDANLGVQGNPRTGAPVTPDRIQMTSDTHNLVSKMLAYDMDDRAMTLLNQVGDANQFMADEVLKLIRSHVQSALIGAGMGTTLTYEEIAGGVNWRGLRRCLTRNWGENNDSLGVPLFICHPDVMFDLTCTEEARKTGIFGGSSIIESGSVYKFAGLNVMQLGSVEKTADVYHNLIVLPGALNYYQDEGIGYSEQKLAHTTTWQMDWDFMYAAFLSQQAPIGCIKYDCVSTIGDDGVVVE